MWPTWADILGREFDYYENWGKVGAGNMHISNSLVEASIKNKFTKDDTIMIMWSNVMREDRYTTKELKWDTPGNLYTKYHNKDYIKKFITVRGCYIRDIPLMHLVSHYLEKIGCKYEFMSMVDLNNASQGEYVDTSLEVNDILEFYKETIIKFKPSIHNIIFNNDWHTRPLVNNKRDDYHALPLEYLEYLDKVLPEYKISNDTRDWIKKVDIGTRDYILGKKQNKDHLTGWSDFHNFPFERL